MSNVHQFRSEEERYGEASLWIERLSEGLQPEGEAELKAWLLEDPANQAVLEKMARLWDKMDSLSRLSAMVPQPAAPEKALRIYNPYVALAAAVVIGLSVLLFWSASRDSDIAPQIAQRPAEIFYETAIGEQQTHMLEDGTKITLNTNSRIGIRFTPDARLLYLESGEVHVEVAKDPGRPLSVLAGGHIVQAIGTAFNIEIRAGQEIELVVTEGTVRIGEQRGPTDTGLKGVEIILPRSTTVITAGQELVTGNEGKVAQPISSDDIQVKLSWREGNLIFRGESLADAAQEVERYTGVEFVFVDENLKEVRVSGFFKAGDVEGMLAVLKENFDIAFQRESKKRVLLYSK